jgi:hypothetical protein
MNLRSSVRIKLVKIRRLHRIQSFRQYLEKSSLTPTFFRELLIRRRFNSSSLKNFVSEIQQCLPCPSRYQVRSFHEKETNVRFAYSEIELGQSCYFAFRDLSRMGNNPWDATKVVYGNKSLKKENSLILQGEDPRLFFFKQEPWIYFQIYNSVKSDVEIRIRNLLTNTELLLHSPFDFNGKNWVPFEKDEQLHFIYSLEPLVILRLIIDEEGSPKLQQVLSSKKFTPSWKTDFDNSIGRVRGGTPAVKFHKNVIGFTHEVHDIPNYQFHSLGLFMLNLESFKLHLIPISKMVPGFLIDPYGIKLSRNKVSLFCSVVEGDLHLQNSNVANIVISFQLKKLAKFLLKTGEMEILKLDTKKRSPKSP